MALGLHAELEINVFSLLHYHRPFGVLFSAGGIIVRILLIKLCVIRVCFLYNLKQNRRRMWNKFWPVKYCCQQRVWNTLEEAVTRRSRNNTGINLAFPEFHSNSGIYFLSLHSLAGSTAERYGCQWNNITSFQSKVEGAHGTGENWVRGNSVCASPPLKVLYPSFILMPCRLSSGEFSESNINQMPWVWSNTLLVWNCSEMTAG